MVQIEDLTKQFGGRVLFKDLSWHIGPDARVGLVGPNGAGKSTILRILAGEEAADEGQVRKAKSVTIGYLAQEIAASPTGSILAQTLDAHTEIRRLEEELEAIEHEMAEAGPGTGDGGEDGARRLARYGDLQHRFEALGGYELEVKARAILGGLGFADSKMHDPVASLSGGYRMRVALARLLLSRPSLLLLDEPTNHLDLESLDWLEEFMAEYDGAVVVASHDRVFLNRMTSEIAELDEGAFALYPGNYDEYLEIRELRREQLEATARQQAKRVADIERFIDRFRAKATKARQAQSRVKMLEKMERIEAPARRRKAMRLSFPQPPRGGAESIRLRAVVKRYGDKTVYDGIDFTVARGDRIALVGPNGAGKSTLLRILAGTLPFEAGERSLGHNVTLAYYAQHQLESLDRARSILEEALEGAPEDVRPRVRTLLGSFLFSGDDVEKKIAVLSGGERARVALCKMLLRPANLLLLDEPTNHLDLRSREVLEQALAEYTGTLVFISHDRYFINRLATKICDVKDGRLDLIIGDYDDWQARRAAVIDGPAARPVKSGSPAKPAAPVTATAPPASKPRTGKGSARMSGGRPAGAPGEGVVSPQAGDRRQAHEKRRAETEENKRRQAAARPLRARLKHLEDEIASAEGRLKDVERIEADPAVWADGARARSLSLERREVEEKIAWLYKEWEHLSAQVEV